MKLLTKTSLLIITVSIFIFFIGNIVFFQVTKYEIQEQVNTELTSVMHRVMKQIRKDSSFKGVDLVSDIVKIKEVPVEFVKVPQFSDTLIFDQIRQKYTPHRSLIVTLAYNDKNYKIEIYKSLMASNVLIEQIAISSFILILIFIFFIFYLNRYVFAKVWSGFFSTIKNVEDYDIKSMDSLTLKSTEIEEFDKLNNVLASLVNRIRNDYLNLKDLTANTSHEIQTPLAIIKSKAENLLQAENLNEEQLIQLSNILEGTERLSKLNQSLLLIAKIENNQYHQKERVRLKDIINKTLNNYTAFAEAGNYRIASNLDDQYVKINPVLIDILVGNLIKNAFVHNHTGGILNIDLKQSKFVISNSGETLKFPKEKLFERFIKDQSKANSSGLGLTIVKKICEYYDLPIEYNYQNKLHSFMIDFSTIQSEKLNG